MFWVYGNRFRLASSIETTRLSRTAMIDDIESKLLSPPVVVKTEKKPGKVRPLFLILPICYTTMVTILINESAWNGILSLSPHNETTFADVTRNIGWQVICWVLAGGAWFFSEITMCVLVFRSWTYVRAYLLVTIPLLLSVVLILLNAEETWTDGWNSLLQSSCLEWLTAACGINWVSLAYVWLMILLGDELEGILGCVMGLRTGNRTPPLWKKTRRG